MINFGEPFKMMQSNGRDSSPSTMKFITPQPQALSFGWGDFPVVEASATPSFLSNQGSSEKNGTRNNPHMDLLEVSSSSSSSSMSSTSSLDGYDSDENLADETKRAMNKALSSSAKKNRLRAVQFSTVQVQEHSLVLGDHPWAEEYPIALDWSHIPATEYPVEEFEQHYRKKQSLPMPQRPRRRLPRRLSVTERKERLLLVGETCHMQLQLLEAERKRIKAEEAKLCPMEISTRMHTSNSMIFDPVLVSSLEQQHSTA